MLFQMEDFIPSYAAACSVADLYHFFSQLSVDGHLRCFHSFAIVHNAAVNTGVCVSF